MNGDLDIIVKTYPIDQDKLHVYAIGDVHAGSPDFDEKSIRKKIQIIKDDPMATLVLAGDLGDFGLKNSKSNVYFQTMTPTEQMDYLYELFLPVADKISGCVPGNHEERLVREVGICPALTLVSRLGCPEVYRENVAITKYLFGSHSGNKQQNCFIGITTHGSTRNKHGKFIGCFEGHDFEVSAHVHQPSYSQHGKIRINPRHNVASHVAFKSLVVDAHLSPGGYGLKKEYEVAPPPELQYLELYMKRDGDKVRNFRKVINFHTIQL